MLRNRFAKGSSSPISSKSSREKSSLGVRSKVAFPFSKRITRSLRETSSKSWVIEITVNPYRSLTSRTVRISSRRPSGSNILVASSKMMILGRKAIIPAMATRCFCPPDNLAGSRSLNSSMRTIFKDSSTRCTISSLGIPWFSNPNATSSSTVAPTNWLSGFWKTMPISLRLSQTFSGVNKSPEI